MAYEPPIALLDACVLYPFQVRNLLVQCGVDRLIEVRWTDQIHDEWMRNLAANTPGLTAGHLARTRNLMKAVLPDADVRGYEHHIEGIALPDPDDRHVVAAAVAGGASMVVTWNTRDFPEAELAQHGLIRQTPDQLLTRLHAVAPGAVLASVSSARLNLRVSAPGVGEFLDGLHRQGLLGFVAAVRSGLTKA